MLDFILSDCQNKDLLQPYIVTTCNGDNEFGEPSPLSKETVSSQQFSLYSYPSSDSGDINSHYESEFTTK